MGWFFGVFLKKQALLFKKKQEKKSTLSLLNISAFVKKAIKVLYHLKACFFVIKTV